ncbi:MAG TPA: hypothetical protein VGA12_07540 [Burkholderiales bacterium]|jgi:hypothetical protein
MLKWLSDIGKKADHPMYNVEAAAKLLADLPAEHGKAIEEITASLETVAATPAFSLSDRIGVLKLLDETGQKREAAALAELLRNEKLNEFQRRQLWQAMVDFWEHVSAAYRVCLEEIAREAKPGEAAHPERTLVLVRALRALSHEGYALLLRCLPVRPRIWQELAQLFSLAEKEHVVAELVKAYEGDALHTHARQEFLRLPMTVAANPESQRMLEMELSARIIARLAGGFALRAQPDPECNFHLDLAQPAGPVRHATGAPTNATTRYFGAAQARVVIQEMIERYTANPAEPEKRFGNDYSLDEIQVALKRLLQYWGDSPPHRRWPRVKIEAKIRVAHGFTSASELVTRIEFSGMAEMSADQRVKVKQQTGIALQAEQSSAAITEWMERDGSTWGVAVDVPRQDEAWARIGSLCTLQAAGQKAWWLGAIRRMQRDEHEQVHAGIEILSKKPLSVYLRGIGEGAERAENWQTSSGSFRFTYVNALILGESSASGTNPEILLKRDGFNPGIQYEVLMGEQTPHARLEELLERGEDYDRVRVTWLKGAV